MSAGLLLEVAEATEQLRLIAGDSERLATPTREYEKRGARCLAKMASVLEDMLDHTEPQRRGGKPRAHDP